MPTVLILLPEGNTGFLGVSVQLRHVSTFKAQATNGNRSDGQHNFFSANLGMDSLFFCLFGFCVWFATVATVIFAGFFEFHLGVEAGGCAVSYSSRSAGAGGAL